MRVVIAGGGTGGHIVPALAIARELRSRYSAEILFIGTARGMEGRLVPQAGFALELVQVGALKGVGGLTRLKTLFDLPRAVLRSRSLIRNFKADVVVGVGGYASGPAMLAAILGGTPTLAFESNAVPGFANRMVARFVSAAAVHFPETAKYFRNATVTGVPVRKEFFAISPQSDPQHPAILVTGGSQGARALNRAFAEAAPQLAQRIPGLRITHQTGERDLAEVQAAYRASGVAAEVSAFIADMPAAFARADLLVCRSGASTVAEAAAAGKPAIFVPFPHATDDHQKRNAQALTSQNAAVLLEESPAMAAKLVEILPGLIADRGTLQKMSEAAKRLAHPQAVDDIAAMVAGLAGETGN